MNYGNKSNNRRAYQPKTSITNQVITEQEKLAAETALRSLKQKMANKKELMQKVINYLISNLIDYYQNFLFKIISYNFFLYSSFVNLLSSSKAIVIL